MLGWNGNPAPPHRPNLAPRACAPTHRRAAFPTSPLGGHSPGQEKERSELLHTLGTVQALVSGSMQKPAGAAKRRSSEASTL